MRILHAFFFTCILLLCNRAYTQSPESQDALAQFYGKNPDHSRYEGIRHQLASLLESAAMNDVPFSVLLDRLHEGAAKHAPPEAILDAMSEELDRLERIKSSYNSINNLSRSQNGREFFTDASYEETMRQFSIFLRSGLPFESLSDLLLHSSRNGIAFPTALLAIGSLVRIPGIRDLDAAQLTRLGISVLSSTLSPSGYSTLSALFLKGRISGLSYATITDIIVDSLDRGGGLVQIEKEITRRSGKQ